MGTHVSGKSFCVCTLRGTARAGDARRCTCDLPSRCRCGKSPESATRVHLAWRLRGAPGQVRAALELVEVAVPKPKKQTRTKGVSFVCSQATTRWGCGSQQTTATAIYVKHVIRSNGLYIKSDAMT